MRISLLKELGANLFKYMFGGIVVAFILIIIVGITTRYCHYNDNSFALIKYGYSLYKEDLIDEINWTRVGDKFMVKNSDYTDFKAKYNQSRFLDDINDNKDKFSEGLNTNSIRVQLKEDFIRIKYKMVD
ncbi:hypothetical protein [Veillonella denticariosi]|uniref:hypothetical protein n=1 Tax=Veillonella denticariosi TaxID=419208 RepID=UPI00249361C4|nr:hypothetical protein [Veillonella denticariosi]